MSDDLFKIILADAVEKMSAAVAHIRRDFATVRTGRASPSLFEKLTVEAYGVEMRMQELVSFSVPEARQLLITPHDPANVSTIERAINKADLGLVPSSDGRSIRLAFPELTEERRRDLVRIVNGMAEDGKNRLRSLRRHARKEFDEIAADGGVSQDDLKWMADQIDELTQKYEAEVEQARSAKEDELLEV